MSSYLNESHKAWLPRHCVISMKEDIPYLPVGEWAIETRRFSPQKHLDMCASAANKAINKIIGRYSQYQSGFTTDKKKP